MSSYFLQKTPPNIWQCSKYTFRKAATGDTLPKKLFLKNSQYSQENTSVGDFNSSTSTRIRLQKETSTQAFSFEYCEIFKNTYFEEHLRTAASASTTLHSQMLSKIQFALSKYLSHFI